MNNLDKVKWHVEADGMALAKSAAEFILHESRLAIGKKGSFSIVLAGGRTPLHTYRYLVRSDAEWGQWQVFFGDERCVAKDDPQRNDLLIAENLFDDISIADNQINHMLADAGFEIAISDYEKKIRHAMPFDLVILGMGEDGHTASLFPGHDYDETQEIVAVRESPKPPSERISLNYPTLSHTRKLMILVEGKSKRPAVKAWLAGDDLPIARVSGLDTTDVFIDNAAYPQFTG